jgi:hypothetical protein
MRVNRKTEIIKDSIYLQNTLIFWRYILSLMISVFLLTLIFWRYILSLMISVFLLTLIFWRYILSLMMENRNH